MKPNISFEWRLNLTHVFTVIGAVAVMATGYFRLENRVDTNEVRAQAKFAEYDQKWALQRGIDDEQNQRVIRAFNVLTESLREVKADLRSDIRDLRADISKRPK